ncbi:PARP domain-containing protein [Naegleria gruberi]|uniref:PARP domain-containing protein n=1 Tax=Naegleria gruberi TaxID=5762 RepID=D2W180_NAEGR|nr:PARP domain-containing protein [Naegleria gruberi]EFC37136.1 PARP domain-containing protein [Naegleria gruberi]|eukprot:XP_002669880.1 PARP domain-containing protein [Naegleria gruberi strain NEG-M]
MFSLLKKITGSGQQQQPIISRKINSEARLSENDMKDLEKLTNELNSKISSPNLRALLAIYSKNIDEINGSEVVLDQSIADLENRFLSVHKEQKSLIFAHPELSNSNEDEEMVDGEDMYEYIKKKSMIKNELKKLNSEFSKSKITYCHYFCKEETDFIQKNGNKKDECKSYILRPSVAFDPFIVTGEDFHFRLASSFLNHANAGFTLNEVTYVCNPYNLKKFNEKKRELAKRHNFMLDSMKPLILFHGNRLESNYDSIMKTNFSISKVGSNTGNLGYYGKGVYFSSIPSYSAAYAGTNILLVCLVFTGKAYPLQQITMGCPRQEGYDSHTSPDGYSEVVIFDEDQILPIYKIKYSV